MDIENLQDAMKLQQDLTTKLNQRMEVLRKDKPLPLDALITEKEESIERLHADIEQVKQERAAAVSRWDQRIEKRKTMIVTLENELAELKKKISGRKNIEKNGNEKKSSRKKKSK